MLFDEYNIVRVFSSPQVFLPYQQFINFKNPDGRSAHLGVTGIRSVNIASIKMLDQKDLPNNEVGRGYVAAVHIEEKGSAAAKSLDENITIEFKYADLDLSPQDKCLNPLGFRVLSYSYAP